MQIRVFAFTVPVATLLLCLAPVGAHSQTNMTPTTGTLTAPGKQKLAVKPTVPIAAPRPAVHQSGPPAKITPPVVRAQGPVHAKPAKKPGAEKPPAGVPPAAAMTPPPPPDVPAEMAKGSATGMPLPRYAALRSDEVNLRAGPGTRYPIEWVYKRRDLPVRIEREFEIWRLVADPDGIKGWVHQATLTGRRSFVVTGTERSLRRQPEADTQPVAMLMPGVVGQIRSCDPATLWCQLQVGDFRGWLKRDEFWGVLPGEAIK